VINSDFITYFRSNCYIFLLVTLSLSACGDQTVIEKEVDAMRTVPFIENDINLLVNSKSYRVLFGHHSVGDDILNGLREITQEKGIDYRIADIEAGREVDEANLVDFRPGRNTDPLSKIDGFVEQMANLPDGFIPNVAFIKFCYVDFTPETNIAGIMSYYLEKITFLEKEYPNTRFAHSTIPLKIRPTDIKSRIKRLLRQQVWEDASNVSRAKFNRLLLEIFPDDPIFDIALIESTRLDGTRTEFIHGDSIYPSLAPEYTEDGGHLNSLGRRVSVTSFIVFLNSILGAEGDHTP
jgi:hypothetical protein